MTKGRKEIYDLLVLFKNKAGAWQSQYQAEAALNKLKPLLNQKDYDELYIARRHYQIGEGAMELYDVCNKLLI